ncbi:MAG: MotA/TolQ/ExbB proton channel family protein, partial [Planctomycetota bacterium]
VFVGLGGKGFASVPESTWRRWIDHSRDRHGPIGRLLDRVVGRSLPSDQAIVSAFDQVRIEETAPFERDLKVMKVAVSAAPLFGLLGTVTGMLTTFSALASGSGGDQTMGMIAAGISEALITTETGLVVALPGLFYQYTAQRRLQRYKAFLAHLETVCTQTVHRRLAERLQRVAAERARRQVASVILDRLRADRGSR